MEEGWSKLFRANYALFPHDWTHKEPHLRRKVREGHLAVDGTSGKYPEFKGNVATVYYMDVGEAMGKAMVELLKNK